MDSILSDFIIVLTNVRSIYHCKHYNALDEYMIKFSNAFIDILLIAYEKNMGNKDNINILININKNIVNEINENIKPKMLPVNVVIDYYIKLMGLDIITKFTTFIPELNNLFKNDHNKLNQFLTHLKSIIHYVDKKSILHSQNVKKLLKSLP